MSGRKDLKSEDKFKVDEQHLTKSTAPETSKPPHQTNSTKSLPKKEVEPQIIHGHDERLPPLHEPEKRARVADLHPAHDMQGLPGPSGYHKDKFRVDGQYLTKSTVPQTSKPPQHINGTRHHPKKEVEPQHIRGRDEGVPPFHEPEKHAGFADLYTAHDMQGFPGPSGYCNPDRMISSELGSAEFVKNLLPGTHKRKSALISHYKTNEKVDFANEADSDSKIGIDSCLSDKDPKQLLAAIRTLPVRMKEKRDYRDRILQATAIPENEMPYLNLFYSKAKKKIPKIFKEEISKYEIWSMTFKLIEGKFGTGVVSYFVFLRWLLVMNIVIFLITLVFIILPQTLGKSDGTPTNVTLAQKTDIFETSLFKNLPTPSSYSTEPKSTNSENNLLNSFSHSSKRNGIIEDLGSLFDTYAVKGFVDATLYFSHENYTDDMRKNLSRMCTHRYEEHLKNTTDTNILSRIQDFFQGTGWLEYTLLFMGYYQPEDVRLGIITYNMSVAFVAVLAILLLISVVMMVSYSSTGVQESMLQSNLHEMYCYVVFCGWDFCISEEKTAKHHHNNILQELTSTLSEERRKAEVRSRTQREKIKVYSIRCLINLLTLLSVVGAYYLFFYVAKVQLEMERTSSADGFKQLFFQFLPSITITSVNFSIPLFLYILVPYEKYTIRGQISVTLVRVILLRQASIIMLLSSFYDQISCLPRDQCGKGMGSCPSPLCWETYVGQQMYRLAILDMLVHICVVFFWETPRSFMYKRWKNQFTELFGKQLFDIPTQVLALVYSQTLCWLGMFYCPLLPAITVAKYIILFYIKRFAVLQNYAPEQVPYRTSRSNAIFGLVLLLSFFVTIAVLGYSVAQFRPSPGCGPYRIYDHMMHAVKNAMDKHSSELNDILLFMLSPLFIVPIIILLCLAMYYYITKASAHKKMVKLLKVQLTMEGTDKQFLLKRVMNIKPRTDVNTRKEK